MRSWKTISSKEDYKNPFFTVDRKEITTHTGKNLDYYVINKTPYSMIVPVIDKSILLIKEYRVALGDFSLSIPGGHVEENQKPIQAAAAELEEETGYKAASLELIGKYSLAPDWLNQECFVYLASGMERLRDKTEEDLEVNLFPFTQVKEFLASGKIIDADGIACLGLFFNKVGATL